MIIRSTITAAGVAGLLLCGCADREREIRTEERKPAVTTGAEFEQEGFPAQPQQRPAVPEPPPGYEQPEREMEREMRLQQQREMEQRQREMEMQREPEAGWEQEPQGMRLDRPAEDLTRYEGREPIGTLRGRVMAAPMPDGEPAMGKTAAISMRFPPGTVVRIVNPQTNRAVLTRIVAHPQTMPPADIVLSPAAAQDLGIAEGDRADVRIEVIEMGEPQRRQLRMQERMQQHMQHDDMQHEMMRKQEQMQEQMPEERNQ